MSDFLAFCGLVLALFGTAVVIVVGIIAGPAKWFSERSCNAIGDGYGLPADFDLWANTCWLTLPDGTKLDADKYRAVEERAVTP